ncbi:MAG: hypothetical protein MI700_11705 [Balneolales bacterium]|nr:hypothetical protein [Balneolales bacterium]
MRTFFLISLIACTGFPKNQLQAQEIDFGSYYYNYSITILPYNGGILDFGTLLMATGLNQIQLTSPSAAIFSIEGINNLDVQVSVTSPLFIYLEGEDELSCTDSSCRIPFDVYASYANRGSESTSQAITFGGINNNLSARFPIRYKGNAPPGPPPTPVYAGYDPNIPSNLDTAYLYIYGDLTVGSHIVGDYSGQVNITIVYE